MFLFPLLNVGEKCWKAIAKNDRKSYNRNVTKINVKAVKDLKKFIRGVINFFKGCVLGLANIIPGVSGGTMAVSMDCYDEYVETLGVRNLKKNLFFLLTAGAGMLLSIWFFSMVASNLIETYAVASALTFVGFIVGSLPLIFKHTRRAAGKFSLIHFLGFALGLGIMIFMSTLSEGTNDIVREFNLTNFIWLTCMMALSAFSMIIPGISGSLIMMSLGAYSTITNSISEFNLLLIPVVLGAAIGLLLGSRLMSFMLKKFGGITYSVILGLVLGSIIPIVMPLLPLSFNAELFIGLGCLAVAGCLSYFCSKNG